MKHLQLLLILLVACTTTCTTAQSKKAISYTADELVDSLTLREKIGRLFMIGIEDQKLTRKNPVVSSIQDCGVGGVIIMSQNVAKEKSSKKLERLCRKLQNTADYPLFIGVDQEGGNIMRLRPSKGYPAVPSHAYLGELNNEDTTRHYAALTAQLLQYHHFNINFAPCVDVNVNPDCPVIAKLNRSFSANPEIVSEQAAYFIDEHRKHHILTSIKHFPGHGSSQTDSHRGLTDISDTWQEKELQPYEYLIRNGYCDMVMVGHIFNRHLDPVYPASLSKATIDGLLRTTLGWDGVVISDDLVMDAIENYYSLEQTLYLALNAGIDILLLSSSKQEVLVQAIDLVEQMVLDGRISESRINESVKRITALYAKIRF